MPKFARFLNELGASHASLTRSAVSDDDVAAAAAFVTPLPDGLLTGTPEPSPHLVSRGIALDNQTTGVHRTPPRRKRVSTLSEDSVIEDAAVEAKENDDVRFASLAEVQERPFDKQWLFEEIGRIQAVNSDIEQDAQGEQVRRNATLEELTTQKKLLANEVTLLSNDLRMLERAHGQVHEEKVKFEDNLSTAGTEDVRWVSRIASIIQRTQSADPDTVFDNLRQGKAVTRSLKANELISSSASEMEIVAECNASLEKLKCELAAWPAAETMQKKEEEYLTFVANLLTANVELQQHINGLYEQMHLMTRQKLANFEHTHTICGTTIAKDRK